MSHKTKRILKEYYETIIEKNILEKEVNKMELKEKILVIHTNNSKYIKRLKL